MQRWLESLRMGWQSLATNKLRSWLTAFSVALGAGAIALLVSLASSALATITTGIDAVGGRELIFVEPKKPAHPTAQSASRLTPDDAASLRGRVPGVAEVAYLMSMRNQLMLGAGRRAEVDVAIGAAYQRFLLQGMVCGRPITEQEQALNAASAVVLSKPVAEELFGSSQAALGQPVVLWGRRYDVIGVSAELARFGFNMGGVTKKRAVFVSTSSALRTESIEPDGFIVVRDDGTASHDLQMRIIASVLSYRHRGVDDFEFFDLKAFMNKFDTVFAGLRAIVGLIAAVSLFIAGAGIMNVMLASVRQRVAEIGIRRALGASQADIRRQFLIESCLLGGVGGATGSAAGTLLASGAALIAVRFLPAWENHPSFIAAAVAALVSVAVGLAFGLAPARKAAALDVVDCLRGDRG